MSQITDSLHPNESSPALGVRNLRFAWPGSRFELRLPQLTLAAGERVFLFGPSGSGKTTLLNLISGILRPQEGEILIAGTDITRLSAARRDRFRAARLGVVFQQLNLIPFLRVDDNIRLSTHFSRAGKHKNSQPARIHELLVALGLDPNLANVRADHLSVGQQQRVALARALIHGPDLLIADEPTSALDQDSRDAFINLMTQVAKESGTAILFVSHDRSLASQFDREIDIRQLLGELSC